MIIDDAQCFVIKHKLSHQRHTRPVKGVVRQSLQRPRHQRSPITAIEIRHADIATRPAAFCVIHRRQFGVGIGRSTRCGDRVDQQLARLITVDHSGIINTVVILNLLQGNDVRRLQARHDLLR